MLQKEVYDFPIRAMRKQRPREVKSRAQGHTARRWENWDYGPIRAHPITTALDPLYEPGMTGRGKGWRKGTET